MQLFFSGFLLSLSLCLDLGMVNVATIKTGLERGFLRSFLVGFGSSLGDLVYAVLSMIGISLLLEHVLLRWILWIGGTIVLCYLAIHMLRETIRPKQLQISSENSLLSDQSWFKAVMFGMGLALSSPSAILWFATIGGSIIATTGATFKEGDTTPLLVFFIGFFCAGLVWSLFVAYASGQARKLMGPKLIRFFSLVSALLFVYFGSRVFMNGVHTLL